MSKYKHKVALLLQHPNGNEYPVLWECAGEDITTRDVAYYFEEGNFSCDCNKISLIRERFPEVGEMGCGDTILIKQMMIHTVLKED